MERGEEPTENARLALEQAMQLAPFDKSLRMNAAMMQASEGKIAIARQTIAPIANDPHGGGLAQTARRFYEAMAGVEEGTAWNPGATLDLATAIADAARDEDTGGSDGTAWPKGSFAVKLAASSNDLSASSAPVRRFRPARSGIAWAIACR